MQLIIDLFVKLKLTIIFILLILLNQFTDGFTFSSFLNNLDSSTQEDLSNLQHLNQYSTDNVNRESNCEELLSCNDQGGFEGIKWLHRQLDDDQNGNVDMAESADFFKTDLNHSDANEKQLQFHGNDKHISVEDLWLYWIRSEVHNWTVDQAIEWLHNSVELGQYEENFRANNINGTSFPRLASSQSSFLSVILGIKDPIHKQKIALKAMDLVLFGVPKTHNYLKDLMLVFSFLVAMLGCCYAALQRKNSQNHLKKMLKDLEALQKAEQQLSSLQVELHQAKREQEAVKTEKIRLEENLLKEGSYPHFYLRGDQSSLPNVSELNKICELEEDLRLSKEHISRLEEAFEKKQWTPPQKLQYWLQLTHELELKNHNAKRQAAELQLLAAKEGCEKLKKKRSSFLGSFRVAHGTSIDDVDNRILQAKESLAEVTKDLQERLYRWKQIERLCNFQIQQNRGELFLQSELYKQLIGNGKNQSLKNTPFNNSSMQRTNSEGTIIESEDSYNAQTNPIGFSTGSNMNISNLHYRLHPVLNGEKLSTKPLTNHVKNINTHDKKAIQNGNGCDEDSTTSEENSERKPKFALGDVNLKESLVKENFIKDEIMKINGKSTYQNNNYHKEEDNLNQTANDLDYLNSSLNQSKTSLTNDLDSIKATKKRKSYKIFAGLRKRGSKYSSQESH